MVQVLAYLFKPYPSPCITRLFLEYAGIAKGSQRSVSRFFGAHARRDVFGNLLFEMELNLVVYLLSTPVAVE